jgi:hypothetical protein
MGCCSNKNIEKNKLCLDSSYKYLRAELKSQLCELFF